jgi:cell division septal protein FtsQ
VISKPPSAEPPSRRRRIAVSLLVAAGAVGLVVGGVFVSRSSMLHARAIDVRGASHRSHEQVVEAAGVSLATNVLWLDEGVVERRLAADPWIAGADVRVALPWTIEIEVRERAPVAVASDGLREVLVAGDGTSLGTPAVPGRGLPRIQLSPPAALGVSVQSPRPAALAIGAMAPRLRAEVATVTVLVDGTLELRLEGGVAVRYGGAVEVRRKAAVLGRILGWARREGETVAAVNVVAPGHPAVRLVG